MMERMHGRPASAEGRLPKEMRVYDLLDSLGVEYDRVDHAAAMTMADCEAIDRALGTPMCKNLFLCNRQKTQFYLLMIPGDKTFHTRDVSRQLGVSRLSFAEAAYMEEFLDITPGSVSVMGLMNDTGNRVRLLIDREVLRSEALGCHPCVNTASLRIGMRDLMETLLPRIGHGATVLDLPRDAR